MFHVSDNLFFGRLIDGSVRILKFKNHPAEYPKAANFYHPDLLEFDQTIGPGNWASVVAAVSLQGECRGRFYEAQRFHMNPQPKQRDAED